jgi:hypothetical protein
VGVGVGRIGEGKQRGEDAAWFMLADSVEMGLEVPREEVLNNGMWDNSIRFLYI